MMSDAIDTFLLQGQAANEAPIATGKLRADISVIEEARAHEISVGNTRLIEYEICLTMIPKPHTIKQSIKRHAKT